MRSECWRRMLAVTCGRRSLGRSGAIPCSRAILRGTPTVPGTMASSSRRTAHKTGSSIMPIRGPVWVARMIAHPGFSPSPGQLMVCPTSDSQLTCARKSQGHRERWSHSSAGTRALQTSGESSTRAAAPVVTCPLVLRPAREHKSGTKALVAFPSQTLPVDRLGPPNPRRILVIDDEADIRESLELLLSSENYAVDLAENATAGFHKVEAGNYDLILLDLMMPDRSGMELLADI